MFYLGKENTMRPLERDSLSLGIDPVFNPDLTPPSSSGWAVPGPRGRIMATYFMPAGAPPYPTVFLTHGLPGNDKLHDFAQYLRSLGFFTVGLHYSGSWGSDGDYHFAHCLEDAQVVLEWLAAEQAAYIDFNRFYNVGHSLGGLIATRLLAESDLLKGGVIMMPADMGSWYDHLLAGGQEATTVTGYIDFAAQFLRGLTKENVISDISSNPEDYRLATYAPKLSKKPAMIIAGTYDTLLPREENLDLLAAAVKKEDDGGTGCLIVKEFGTDHDMDMNRRAILECVGTFLADLAEAK